MLTAALPCPPGGVLGAAPTATRDRGPPEAPRGVLGTEPASPVPSHPGRRAGLELPAAGRARPRGFLLSRRSSSAGPPPGDHAALRRPRAAARGAAPGPGRRLPGQRREAGPAGRAAGGGPAAAQGHPPRAQGPGSRCQERPRPRAGTGGRLPAGSLPRAPQPQPRAERLAGTPGRRDAARSAAEHRRPPPPSTRRRSPGIPRSAGAAARWPRLRQEAGGGTGAPEAQGSSGDAPAAARTPAAARAAPAPGPPLRSTPGAVVRPAPPPFTGLSPRSSVSAQRRRRHGVNETSFIP